MQKIYSHQNIAMVQLAKSALESRGIASEIKGEYIAGIIGGGAACDAWIELWIVDDARYEEADTIVWEEIIEGDESMGEPWTCGSCGETIDAPFSACWKCGAERIQEK